MRTKGESVWWCVWPATSLFFPRGRALVLDHGEFFTLSFGLPLAGGVFGFALRERERKGSRRVLVPGCGLAPGAGKEQSGPPPSRLFKEPNVVKYSAVSEIFARIFAFIWKKCEISVGRFHKKFFPVWTFDKVRPLGKERGEKRGRYYMLWIGEGEPQHIVSSSSPLLHPLPSEDGQGPFVKSPVPVEEAFFQ